MNQEVYQKAVEFLRIELDREARSLRKMIKGNPCRWWAPYHHFWGRHVRNHLREHGFGEQQLGIDNLDDVYVQMIEDAMKNDN